jgi:hypothetical protein
MGVAEIQAVQAHGMIAMAKHLVANEQETNRMTIQESVDDQTLHELYMLSFEMAVKAGNVGAVMCSYNSVNGFSMCEQKHILSDVLRGQWGFKGYVQSDFFAAHSTAPTLLAGMDNEMPLPQNWSPANLNAALAAGQIQTSDIDNALLRRYTQMFRAAKNSNRLALLQTIVAANSNTVLVLKDSAAEALDPSSLTGGTSAASAILETWFPGQEDGHIVADLLWGVANPSGKLPVTFPQVGQGFMDSITPYQYPGVWINGSATVSYSEALNVGYRWYDAMGKTPAFPFGYGLSYTTFTITNPTVSTGANGTYTVSAIVKNTGSVAGAEVPQVYIALPTSAGEPPQASGRIPEG